MVPPPRVPPYATLANGHNDSRRLATTAFHHVLGRKQSRYREVLIWLDGMTTAAIPGNRRELLQLQRVVKRGNVVLKDYRY